VLANFGGFMALVAPLGYSLSVQLDRVAPGDRGFLGYITGLGALLVVVLGPIVGMLSDRTRSALGRRRPWIATLWLIGLVGLALCALAPNRVVLLLGWLVVQFGIGLSLLIITASLADRVPNEQQGSIGALMGIFQMIASVAGTGVAAGFAAIPGQLGSLLLFLVPGILGTIMVFLFIFLIKEDDSRSLEVNGSVSLKSIVTSYGYNIAKFADFSWNWLGRFFFLFGTTLATTFTTFVFASRMGMAADQIGGIVAIAGLVGVVATAGGAALGGFLSDKIKRRRIFVLISGIIFAVGALLMAFASDMTSLLIGMFVMQLGLGVFSAVDQAIYLSVLPEKETQGGKFVAINQFSTSIPQTIAPILAPSLLLIAGTPEAGNYTLLYIIAAVFALAGGNVIMMTVKSVK
jgi:MFS family permease